MKSVVLTLGLTARNDGYMPDFTYRLTTTLNFLARAAESLEVLEQLEVLVTDWGSETPLSHTLKLTPEAASICTFLYVSPELIESIHGDATLFHNTRAANVAIRRATGQFILLSSADTLLPKDSLDALLRLLRRPKICERDLNKTFLLLPRSEAPWEFVKSKPSVDEWNRYLALNAGSLETHPSWVQYPATAGCGGLLAHAELWHALTGLDEQMPHWGYSDVEVGLRFSQKYPWLELTSHGIFMVHMEHPQRGVRGVWLRNDHGMEVRVSNHDRYNLQLTVNPSSWGLADYDVLFQQPKASTELNDRETAATPTPTLNPADGTIRPPHAAQSPEHSHQSDILQAFSVLTAFLKRLRFRYASMVYYLWGYKDWDLLMTHCRQCWSISDTDVDGILMLAAYAPHFRVRRYLEIGIQHGASVVLLSSMHKSTEIYAVDTWDGVEYGRSIRELMIYLKSRIGYKGYLRFVNGDPSTSLDRLQDSFVGPFNLDLIWIRENYLYNSKEQIQMAFGALQGNGGLIITSNSIQKLDELSSELSVSSILSAATFIRHGSALLITKSLIHAKPLSNDTWRMWKHRLKRSLRWHSASSRFMVVVAILRITLKILTNVHRYPHYLRVALRLISRHT